MLRALVLGALLAGCEYRPLHLDGPDADPAAPAPLKPVPTNPGASTGGGPGTPGAPGTPAPPTNQCDPVTQNCGGGQRCRPDCARGGYVCGPRNPNSNGRQTYLCTSEDDCEPGYACLEAGRTGGSRCARYCHGNGDCEAGTVCKAAQLRCTDTGRTIDRQLCQAR